VPLGQGSAPFVSGPLHGRVRQVHLRPRWWEVRSARPTPSLARTGPAIPANPSLPAPRVRLHSPHARPQPPSGRAGPDAAPIAGLRPARRPASESHEPAHLDGAPQALLENPDRVKPKPLGGRLRRALSGREPRPGTSLPSRGEHPADPRLDTQPGSDFLARGRSSRPRQAPRHGTLNWPGPGAELARQRADERPCSGHEDDAIPRAIPRGPVARDRVPASKVRSRAPSDGRHRRGRDRLRSRGSARGLTATTNPRGRPHPSGNRPAEAIVRWKRDQVTAETLTHIGRHDKIRGWADQAIRAIPPWSSCPMPYRATPPLDQRLRRQWPTSADRDLNHFDGRRTA
jgi:hypothetical protein